MAKSKKAAVSKKTATSKKIKSENEKSIGLLKNASQFVRDITESVNRQVNRSMGVLDGFKEYAIYWESAAADNDKTFNLRTVITDFRTWIYKDNNFLLPNEILTKEDKVAMDKLKDSKAEKDKRDHNRLSTSELPPQVVRDIFSKIQSIPMLIESGDFQSVRDVKSISQIKALKADLNKAKRTKKLAAERSRILGDTYESKRDSLKRAIQFFDDVVDDLLKTFKDDEAARKVAAKVVVSIEKDIRKGQQSINTYFLQRVAALEAEHPLLKSHKDHITNAVERNAIWESNNAIRKVAAKQKTSKKKGVK